MNYLWAFVVGGCICVIGQLLIDLTGLTPAICGRKACGRPSKRKGPSASSPAG